MRYHKIEKFSTNNGNGVRVVLWVSGCEHNCHGCHNPETHDFNGGKAFTNEALEELYDALNHEWISGLTVSGGDPLADKNIDDTLQICKYVREKLHDKTIWIYTGNVVMDDDTHNDSKMHEIMSVSDVIVDGPFVMSLADISLLFRGSSNQRLIDCKKSIAENKIIECC